MLYRVLVIDDDTRLRSLLQEYLSDQGFNVTPAADGQAAQGLVVSRSFDIIVADIMMPHLDGLGFVQWVRALPDPQRSCLPILLLTAMSQPDDRITGLEVGADDYLSKPFQPKELVLRLKNLLQRRSYTQHLTVEPLMLGDLAIDLRHGTLTRDSCVTLLTSTELALLKLLSQTPGRIFTRAELAQQCIGVISERSVDAQIARLRRKIERDAAQPRYLRTVRHTGYTLLV